MARNKQFWYSVGGGVAAVGLGGGFLIWVWSLGPASAAHSVAGGTQLAHSAQSARSRAVTHAVGSRVSSATRSRTSSSATSQTSSPVSVKQRGSTHTTSPASRAITSSASAHPVSSHRVTSSSPLQTATSSSPVAAAAYPSLATRVQQQPVATTGQIQAAIQADNAPRLGEMHWNSADAQTVIQAMGSTSAPTSTTAAYAKTFLYAMLSDNASVFNAMPGDGGAYGSPGQLGTQGIPHNVSQVDQVTLQSVKPGMPWQKEYNYSVTYTTTGGAVVTNACSVSLQFNPSNSHQWLLAVVADLGSGA